MRVTLMKNLPNNITKKLLNRRNAPSVCEVRNQFIDLRTGYWGFGDNIKPKK